MEKASIKYILNIPGKGTSLPAPGKVGKCFLHDTAFTDLLNWDTQTANYTQSA